MNEVKIIPISVENLKLNISRPTRNIKKNSVTTEENNNGMNFPSENPIFRSW